MALPIEDFAVIGDEHTAALLGGEDNGRWQIVPAGEIVAVRRRYRHEMLTAARHAWRHGPDGRGTMSSAGSICQGGAQHPTG